jgi:hypothetical protein
MSIEQWTGALRKFVNFFTAATPLPKPDAFIGCGLKL